MNNFRILKRTPTYPSFVCSAVIEIGRLTNVILLGKVLRASIPQRNSSTRAMANFPIRYQTYFTKKQRHHTTSSKLQPWLGSKHNASNSKNFIFRYLHNPTNFCNGDSRHRNSREVKYIFAVASAPWEYYRRKVIRRTWASVKNFQSDEVGVVFFMGMRYVTLS